MIIGYEMDDKIRETIYSKNKLFVIKYDPQSNIELRFYYCFYIYAEIAQQDRHLYWS